MGVVVADLGMTTVEPSKQSRGGSGPGRPGAIYRTSSGPGSRCGSGIVAGLFDGTYAEMFAAGRAWCPADDQELVDLISIDSTSIRAHQHAAGGRSAQRTGG